VAYQADGIDRRLDVDPDPMTLLSSDRPFIDV
jgi:hypothetical protein